MLLCFLLLLFHAHRVVTHVQKVLSYRFLVEEVVREQGYVVDENLVLAMIYTETKGQGQDIMQASESVAGFRGQITSPRDSIFQGLGFLTKNLADAQSYGVDDWTAVQAYNFGTAYIPFVAENGGQSTVDLARQYSKEVVAPSLGNVTGLTYAYYNPVAIVHGGTSLYYNGGNSYYAKEVAFNLHLIKLGRLLENLW